MEDLLASIRKAIQDDIGEGPASTSAESRGTVIKGAMRELRVKLGDEAEHRGAGDQEIDDIRNRIQRNRTIDEFTRAAPAEPPTLRPAYSEENAVAYEAPQYADLQAPADYGYHDPRYAGFDQELRPAEAANLPPQEAYDDGRYQAGPGMMSAEATAAGKAAFNRLTDALIGRSMGALTIEDVAREMLRDMLKQWLDENLPALVEQLVREEIERVARRGR
jgi:hypothetical protein